MLLGQYQSTIGQRVIDSFDIKTYPGDSNRAAELGLSAAEAAAYAAIAQYGGKYIIQGGKLVIQKAQVATDAIKDAIGGVKGSQVTINRLKGIQFQDDVLVALGKPVQSTTRINTVIIGGKEVTIIPDGSGTTILLNDANALIEVKDVQYLANRNQLRGYFATGRPVSLVVNAQTKISEPVVNQIRTNGGTINVFNPVTKTFTPWVAL